jgi:hypothetical protein
MEKFCMEDGRIIEYGLLIIVRHNGGRPQFFHEKEWSVEGNANCFETLAIRNSVFIKDWNRNIQVKDLYGNVLLRHPYIRTPDTLEFSSRYMIAVEVMDPEAFKKTGYVVFYEKVDGKSISRIREVKPTPDCSLRQRYYEFGFPLKPIISIPTGNPAEIQA